MRPKSLFNALGAVLLGFPFIGAFAQQAPGKIEIVTVFEYPAGGVSTVPQKINDAGDIAGEINGSAGEVRGFIRFGSGRFTPPISVPFEFSKFTDVRGINNSRHVCGFYLNDNFVGFYENVSNLTTYSIAGASTELYDLNDANDFCGAFSNDGINFQAFLHLRGFVMPISIPDAVSAFAFGINDSNEVVGAYIDSASVQHGFFRDAAGTVTAPIDPAGSTSTILFGLNDRGLIVGRFAESGGAERGFVLKLPDTVVVLDHPEATLTSLNGINNNNVMCGSYVDGSGVAHGIVARIRHRLTD